MNKNIVNVADMVSLIGAEDTHAMLVSALTRSEAVVKFRKVSDGSERVMPCTLQPEAIPESISQPSTSQLVCYSTEDEGWRSFRVDSLISVQF